MKLPNIDEFDIVALRAPFETVDDRSNPLVLPAGMQGTVVDVSRTIDSSPWNSRTRIGAGSMMGHGMAITVMSHGSACSVILPPSDSRSCNDTPHLLA